MPLLKQYRLFISHSWNYSERYQSMTQLLKNASNFKWSNSSVPEDKAFDKMTDAELKAQLTKQISPAQVVVIISGMYVNHSKWLQYEINEAIRMGKPILGVKRRGGKVTPTAVSNAADKLVSWSTSSIVNAIRELA